MLRMETNIAVETYRYCKKEIRSENLHDSAKLSVL